MADGAQPQALRYSAFISYSRRDARFARSLHRQLEGYRLPRRGAAHPGSNRAPHARLRPIFRDEEEFCASYDLSGAVREAIAQSDFLIVVCSPNSAASKWVGLEIEDFRAVHGDSRILAALIEGDSSTAFHPALRGSKAITPLAADFRKGAGSHRLSLLKLVAPMAGVGLDDLAQRDAHRRTRRILASGVGGLAATVTIVSLSGLALTARADAERRRTETTGLVEYMLTDMRKTMQRTGRLDQLAALNDGAMQYYRNQDLKRLSEAQLRQRAKLLQAMGEDDEKRGKLEAARESFEDAHRTTAALLAAKPNDPNRIFAHSQSEYWVGFINWRNGDGAAARRHFEAYAALAARLLEINPHNDEWIMEAAYAAGNLGTLALRQAGDPKRAQRHFSAALADKAKVARQRPGDPDAQSAVAQSYAWLADSQRLQGDFDGALASREAQRKILAELLAKNPDDVELQSAMVAHQLALARIEAAQGAVEAASNRLESAHRTASAQASRDPENGELAKQARMLELFRVRTWLSMNPRPRSVGEAISGALGDCKPRSPALADDEISDFCAILLARTLTAAGDRAGAQAAMAAVRRREATRHDVLTAHWGLNLANEARLIDGEAKRGRF